MRLGGEVGFGDVAVASGPLIGISGQVPLDASGRLAGADGDTIAQLRQVFRNIAPPSAAAGVFKESDLGRRGLRMLGTDSNMTGNNGSNKRAPQGPKRQLTTLSWFQLPCLVS